MTVMALGLIDGDTETPSLVLCHQIKILNLVLVSSLLRNGLYKLVSSVNPQLACWKQR